MPPCALDGVADGGAAPTVAGFSMPACSEPLLPIAPAELHDSVFWVTQVTRSTKLESAVGADMVHVDPHKESNMHRHNRSETVLFITGGSGEVLLNESYDVVKVAKDDRVVIRPGQFHAVRTLGEPLDFLSIQSPPILDLSSGSLDLEWLSKKQ